MTSDATVLAGIGRLVEALEAAVVILDARGDIVAANPAWHWLADDIAGDLAGRCGLGQNYPELAAACFSADILGGLHTVLDGTSPAFSVETFGRSATRQRWFALSAKSLQEAPRLVMVMHREVTESRRAALAWRREHEQQAILRHLIGIAGGDGTLGQLLGSFLDRLLTTPWLAGLAKGGIHLAAGPGRNQPLSIVRNLDAGFFACGRFLPAQCCRASPLEMTGDGGLSESFDGRYGKPCPEIGTAPHWCLPLVVDGERIGVLVAYLPADECIEPEQEVFLRTAVDILCGLVRRKRSEQSHANLLLALQQTSNAVLITNDKAEIEFVNAAFTAITGYTAGDVCGRTPGLLRSGETLPETIAALWEVLNSGQAWRGELVNRRKNGELFVARQIISPIAGTDGQTTHYLSLFEDITEQRQLADELNRHRQHLESQVAERTQDLREANRALDEQRMFIQAIADNVPALVSYWGTDLRCRFANGGYRECYARSPEAMLGIHLGELLGEAHFAQVRGHLAEVLQGRRQTFERSRICADGGIRHAQVTYIPDIKDGVVQGFYAFGADVTALKLTKQELASRTADLERTQSISHVGSWQLDIVADTLTWSDETYAIFGLPKGTPLNVAAFAACIHPDDAERVIAAWNAAQAGHPYDIEHRIVAAGETKWVHEKAELIFDGSGRAIAAHGAVQDITGRKAAESATRAALEEARRLAATKGEFLANMSHEIRTPLNAVLGFAQTGIRDNAGRKAQTSFQRILDSGQHLLGIINDILDYSKIEAGKLRIERIPFDLRRTIARATSLTSARADEKGLDFQLVLDPGMPETVVGDPLRLGQILVNLLSNAIKFTDLGKVCLSVSHDGEEAVFRVVDSGIGVSQQALDRLFVAFEQADNSTTRRYGGTGLGLAICARLSQAMGGAIAVESQPGSGATFELRLPLPATTCRPVDRLVDIDHRSRLREGRQQRLAGVRILVAEDTEINRILLDDMLTPEGAQLHFTENGRQAVDWLRDNGPGAVDMVLMDVQMPVMDGHEATRRLQAFAPGLPVIGLTAHALYEERDKCMDSGMVQHIGKPVDIELLIGAILRHARPAPRLPDAASAGTPGAAEPGDAGPIDWLALEASFDHRQDFIDRLLDLTLKNYAETPARLRQAVRAGDLAAIASLAHKLKSVAGSIRANPVYELACQTEKAIQAEDESAARLGESLAEHLAALIGVLASRQKGQGN